MENNHMIDLKEKLRTTNILSQRNQRALQNEAADRIEALEAALREILVTDTSFAREIARTALTP